MRNLLLRLIPALLCATLTHASVAGAASTATAPHLSVNLVAEDAAVTPGQEQRLALHFVLEKGWHIYWKNPGDSGEAPRVTWTLPAGLQAGELSWPTPKRLIAGPLVDYGYEDELVLLTPLHAAAGLTAAKAAVGAQLHWLVCSEVCIPGQAELSLELPVRGGQRQQSAQAALFATAEKELPMALPAGWQLSGLLDAYAFHLRASTTERPEGTVSFLPLDPGQIENAGQQEFTANPEGFALRLPRSEQLIHDVSHLRGLLLFESAGHAARSFAVDLTLTAAPAAAPTSALKPAAPPAPSPPPPSSVSLPLALLLALLGGALLNLMPCVFPVLSIKALGLVSLSGAERGHARAHGLAYSLGILISFWALAGLLIALRYTGQKLGWGFHLQSPQFLFALSALLFLLGLNLLGVFELGLGLTQLGQVTAEQHGYSGAFATGVLATVVATPCTAPFMGTAVGFALSQPALPALLIFSALGLGLALPYLLLLFIPGALRILPRPGAWMETFKQAMGFLLFATVIWLAWVLGMQGGAPAVVMLLGGLLVVGVAGWVLHRWGEGRTAQLTAALLILVAVAVPIWTLPTRSAFANQSASSTQGSVPGSAPDSTDDLAWEPFSPTQLATYRSKGQPVFLDFTAAWCVSCKVNELLIIRSPEVRARLRELNVVPMKADWTNQDPIITQALAEFGRSGVPFYALYGRAADAPPRQLPEVLTTRIVLDALAQLK